jgi:peptidoglycan/LPS O-acetylase OafA/YrhL
MAAMQLKYRPEIDGLRALAVVAVLAFHLDSNATGNPLLAGGFLGVDVFFVISGFLITSLIIAGARDEGGFSYLRFYERRARRLLPALLVVMLASLPLAWLLLLPGELVGFAKSVIASLAFGSNFYWLWTQQAYAAESAQLLPFLHTWSLAVEEQYYLLFPLLFLLAWRRWPARTPLLLLVACVLSIGASEALAAKDASTAFYMLPSRLWELMAGAWLACRRTSPQALVGGLARVLPALGLVMIVAAMVVPGWQSMYPGVKTLLPVLGTVLAIGWAGKDPATRLLASRPMVAIGLISYSLYLWHYPVYAFGRHWHPQPGTADKSAWVALSFALAGLSWWLVERPFRDRNRLPRRPFFAIVLAATLAVVLACAAWIASAGAGARLGYLEGVLKRSEREWTTQDGLRCHSGGAGRNPVFPLRESCVFKYAHDADPRTLVLVGDSHAATLSEELRRLAQANGMNFVQVTEAGCPHIPGTGETDCLERGKQLRGFVAAIPRATVVFSARWPRLLESSAFDNREGSREANYVEVPQATRDADFPRLAREVHDALEGVAADNDKLVIVYPVPEQGFNIGDRLLARRWQISGPKDLPTITTSYSVFRDRVRRSYQVLDGIHGANVVRVYPEQLLCRPASGRCVVSEGERIYYQGDNHLSPLGARLVVADIARELQLAPVPAAALK